MTRKQNLGGNSELPVPNSSRNAAHHLKKRTLWGGVSGAMVVDIGTEEQTRQSIVEAIDILGDHGGFILSPVDNVRESTTKSKKNVEIFIQTWKENRNNTQTGVQFLP